MKLNIAYLITFGLFFVILISILLFFLNMKHWSRTNITENLIVPIHDYQINSFIDGMKVAKERIDKWRPNTEFTSVQMRLDGQEAIKNRNTKLLYTFHLSNSSWFGVPHILAQVSIDTNLRSIDYFTVYSGERLDEKILDTSNWIVNFDDIYHLIDVYLSKHYQLSKPIIIVNAFSEIWNIVLYDGNLSKTVDSVYVNATNGEVVELP
ncbi:hypothetical protein [Paenibacillus sp. DMB5]|uniref:hypothetical protein n=1 Tax=Paenibacillus sp. DMB5 TaxID=1780103 RepID=UPI000FE13FB2|nr:hypothetical protein [Paenibacillus sp. DMB5]